MDDFLLIIHRFLFYINRKPWVYLAVPEVSTTKVMKIDW